MFSYPSSHLAMNSLMSSGGSCRSAVINTAASPLACARPGGEAAVHAKVPREPKDLEAGVAPVNREQLLPGAVDRPVLDDNDLEVIGRVGGEHALEPPGQLFDAASSL